MILDAWGWYTGMNQREWHREGGGRGVQDGEHMYTCGRFMLMYGKTIQYRKVINLQLNKLILKKKHKLSLYAAVLYINHYKFSLRKSKEVGCI